MLLIGFPIFFAIAFCAVYVLLILVNTVFALISGYQQRSRTLLLALKKMKIIAGSTAALGCIWAYLWYFTHPESIIN